MKSQLMSLANALRKTGLSLSEAVKRAWETIKLKAKMLVSETAFSYTKETGEVRTARGFFGAAPERTSDKPEKVGSILAIKYFDLDAQGWRSFRADRLILA